MVPRSTPEDGDIVIRQDTATAREFSAPHRSRSRPIRAPHPRCCYPAGTDVCEAATGARLADRATASSRSLKTSALPRRSDTFVPLILFAPHAAWNGFCCCTERKWVPYQIATFLTRAMGIFQPRVGNFQRTVQGQIVKPNNLRSTATCVFCSAGLPHERHVSALEVTQ